MTEMNQNEFASYMGRPGSASAPFEIAVLPLQSTTLFPATVVPLTVGRPRSVAAVEAALATEEKLLACFGVRPGNAGEHEAGPNDLFQVGTLVTIKRMMRDETSQTMQVTIHSDSSM